MKHWPLFLLGVVLLPPGNFPVGHAPSSQTPQSAVSPAGPSVTAYTGIVGGEIRADVHVFALSTEGKTILGYDFVARLYEKWFIGGLPNEGDAILVAFHGSLTSWMWTRKVSLDSKLHDVGVVEIPVDGGGDAPSRELGTGGWLGVLGLTGWLADGYLAGDSRRASEALALELLKRLQELGGLPPSNAPTAIYPADAPPSWLAEPEERVREVNRRAKAARDAASASGPRESARRIEGFEAGLPPGWVPHSGTYSVDGGVLTLNSGCMVLPYELDRSRGLRIEARVNIAWRAAGDLNFFVFYDPIAARAANCYAVTGEGYDFGFFPGGSDNSHDGIATPHSVLARMPATIVAGTWVTVGAELSPDGTLRQTIDGNLRTVAHDSAYSAGRVVLRTWGSVSFDSVQIEPLSDDGLASSTSSTMFPAGSSDHAVQVDADERLRALARQAGGELEPQAARNRPAATAETSCVGDYRSIVPARGTNLAGNAVPTSVVANALGRLESFFTGNGRFSPAEEARATLVSASRLPNSQADLFLLEARLAIIPLPEQRSKESPRDEGLFRTLASEACTSRNVCVMWWSADEEVVVEEQPLDWPHVFVRFEPGQEIWTTFEYRRGQYSPTCELTKLLEVAPEEHARLLAPDGGSPLGSALEFFRASFRERGDALEPTARLGDSDMEVLTIGSWGVARVFLRTTMEGTNRARAYLHDGYEPGSQIELERANNGRWFVDRR